MAEKRAVSSCAEAVLLTPVMPSAGGNGLAMRAGLMLEGLARAFEIDVIAVPVFGGVGSPSELALRLARTIHTVELDPDPDAVADLVLRLRTANGRSRAEALHPRPALCRQATLTTTTRIARRLRGAELVLVLRSYLAPFLDDVLGWRARPSVLLDVDDIESSTHRRLGLAEEAARHERLEAHYLPLMDRVLVCSEEDREELSGRLGLRTLSVIPNAVRPPPGPEPPTGEYDLLFVGNLSYRPNIEAVDWLIRQVLPGLRDARVAVVGSRPGPEVRALAAGPRVTLADDVEDVGPWYRASSVAVVPVQRGGGSRIKLIEAFAHHRPVVATSAGAAGLPWPKLDSPVLVADNPEDFTEACRSLLDDPARARQLSERGRKLVNATATVAIVAAQIEELARSVNRARATLLKERP
jgi:glycosyltransferase involved in cell wall biosynthesis